MIREFNIDDLEGVNNLIYRGKEKFDLDIDFIFYEDKYYDQYLKCTQECFYELRKNNDFKPDLVPKSEEERYRLMENKGSIYLTVNYHHL